MAVSTRPLFFPKGTITLAPILSISAIPRGTRYVNSLGTGIGKIKSAKKVTSSNSNDENNVSAWFSTVTMRKPVNIRLNHPLAGKNFVYKHGTYGDLVVQQISTYI